MPIHRPRSLSACGIRDLLRLTAALSLEHLARWSRRQVGLALVYHRIGEPPGDAARELVPALQTRLFAAELAHLKARYRIVPASTLLAAAANRQRGQPFPVAITFDDDLNSHVETAAPALLSAGLDATFFLCGASLSRPKTFWWDALQVVIDRRLATVADLPLLKAAGLPAALEGQPYAIHSVAKALESLPPKERQLVATELERRAAPMLRTDALRLGDVQTLARSGFEFGFHTREHFLLTSLDEQELERALQEGRQEIERVVSQRLQLLAYPHGKADERVAAAAEAVGYKLAFTGRREPVGPQTHPYLIGRLEPRATTIGRFALEVAGALRQPLRRRAAE